jgi:hypothetical protein
VCGDILDTLKGRRIAKLCADILGALVRPFGYSENFALPVDGDKATLSCNIDKSPGVRDLPFFAAMVSIPARSPCRSISKPSPSGSGLRTILSVSFRSRVAFGTIYPFGNIDCNFSGRLSGID